MWRAVLAVLAVVIGTIAMWMVASLAAFKVVPWVGASKGIPIAAILLAFIPCIVDATLGILGLAFRKRLRNTALLAASIALLSMLVLLIPVTTFSLIMAEIG